MTPVRRPSIALLFSCLFGLALGATQALAEPQGQTGKQSAANYTQLVERAKKGDQTVDFVQLREAFVAWTSDPKNQSDAPNRDAMVAAFEENNYAKAVELAEVVLDYEFVNRGLHLAAEDAYRKLGNEKKANFHRDIAAKLLKALLNTGDGKSAETAYRVMSVREEYIIMHELGIEVSSQALWSVNNKAFDVLSGTDPKTGKEIRVYFDISSFFGR
ncbi:MAG TPA: DUF4919 domain-containing protein [Pyrinomonadaceae bacterium]|jgi:hypothetical protein|nr:DUF4919 domain-containing protein [Pyrinomonadaceae bacterium]